MDVPAFHLPFHPDLELVVKTACCLSDLSVQ